MGKRVSLQVSTNARVTIPARIREYYEFPDHEEEEVWIDVEIHGLDGDKHPDHKFATDPEKSL